MANLEWNSSYSVKVRAMDAQHQKLIKMINDLGDAVTENKGEEAMNRVFGELMIYVATHFKTEENLMETNGYPEFFEHKIKHEAIARQVEELKKKARENPQVGMMKLMKFLSDWLIKHIMGTDKQYGVYLNAKGIN